MESIKETILTTSVKESRYIQETSIVDMRQGKHKQLIVQPTKYNHREAQNS